MYIKSVIKAQKYRVNTTYLKFSMATMRITAPLSMFLITMVNASG